MDLELFRTYFNRVDGFAIHNGIRVANMRPGYSEVEIDIKPENLNFMGTIHGAILFGLVDIAAGSALASYGTHCVTLSSNISYIAPATTGKATAISTEVSRTRRTATYDIVVKSEDGKVLSKAMTTMYITGKPIEFDENGNMIPLR